MDDPKKFYLCVCVCFWFKIVVGGVCTESLKSSFETQVSLLAPYIYTSPYTLCNFAQKVNRIEGLVTYVGWNIFVKKIRQLPM